MTNIKSIYVAIFSVLVLAQLLNAEVHISGAISGTLTTDTYIVDAQIWVPEDQTLVIEAGSTFRFDGDLFFLVHGNLIAEGTEGDSIIFEPNYGIPSWKGIHIGITSEEPNKLSYCRISGSNFAGIVSEATELVLTNSTITDNYALFGGGLYGLISSVYISDCVFENNSAAKGAGIYMAANSTLEIKNSTFKNNIATSIGGAILLSLTDASISGCLFEGNRAENGQTGEGGAISTEYSTFSVVNSSFTQNHAGNTGGAIHLLYDSQGTIARNSIYNNSSAVSGGGITVQQSRADVYNCTFDGNTSAIIGSGIFLSNRSNMNLYNSTLTDHSRSNVVFIDPSSYGTIHYSNFYGNSNGNFGGNIPAGTGQVNTVNANGDPADQFLNIFEPPAYENPFNGDYNLQPASALIDAGDPSKPSDPDGTYSDIGAYYTMQGAAVLMVTLTPNNPPIQIPANGGYFSYNFDLQNSGDNPFNFDFWITITMPNGQTPEPSILRVSITVPGYANISRASLPYYVLETMPEGIYALSLNAGSYPDMVAASDEFTFEKLGYLDGDVIQGDVIAQSDLPEEYSLLSAYPNPFNPVTTLSYSLAEASRIKLTVYNSLGQIVETLVDNYQQAGIHEVQFNAESLAGGVYMVELQAGEVRQVQRLILIK